LSCEVKKRQVSPGIVKNDRAESGTPGTDEWADREISRGFRSL
jgi:hypothetical protein